MSSDQEARQGASCALLAQLEPDPDNGSAPAKITFLEALGDVRQAYRPEEFARSHGMTRATLYQLWREGRGPRVIRLSSGPKAKIVIPGEAAQEGRLSLLTSHTVEAA